jgi:hypothetical protein
MTMMQFQIACGERLLDEGIALENEHVKQALKDRNDEEVLRLLDEEF